MKLLLELIQRLCFVAKKISKNTPTAQFSSQSQNKSINAINEKHRKENHEILRNEAKAQRERAQNADKQQAQVGGCAIQLQMASSSALVANSSLPLTH